MKKNRIIKLFTVFCLALLLLGCDSKVNEDNFKKIKNGMTMTEVKAILGDPKESKSIGISGLASGTSATWKDDKTGASINIQFLNDAVQLSTFSK